MVIYKITNAVNGKIYAGQTIQRLKLRWKKHCSDSLKRNETLYLAIRKHGLDNFKIEVIESLPADSTREFLSDREIFWIKELNSLVPNGYNMNTGGNGANDGKASHKNLGKAPPNKGKAMSEAQRIKLSEIKSEMYADPSYVNPNIGRTRTVEQIERMSEARKGKATGAAWHRAHSEQFTEEVKARMAAKKIKAQVYCITNRTIYDSAQAAERALSINNVGLACRGGIKAAGGYQFMFLPKLELRSDT